MRRLGERRLYRSGDLLARCVHNDFHERALLADDDLFELEDTSGDQLPAGPASSWAISLGDSPRGAHDFPSRRVQKAIDRRGQRDEELARVLAAMRHLRDWEPHGELLYRATFVTCVAGEVRLLLGRGWRHVGKGYERARGYFGSRDQFWDALTLAWGIVAVLAVEPGVLRAAQEAGAADERAVAWARERGLLQP